MNIRNIAMRAGLLRADLVMLPTPETLELSSRTADADRDGAFGEAARDLHGPAGTSTRCTPRRTKRTRCTARPTGACSNGSGRPTTTVSTRTIAVSRSSPCGL